MAMSDDGVNFVVYLKKDLKEESLNKLKGVKLIDIVKQLNPEGEIMASPMEGYEETVVIIKGTTNFSGARIKNTLAEFCKVESFLAGHPLVNGENLK